MYEKLGHINFSQLENLSKNKFVNDLPKFSIKQYVKCDTCMKNKIVSVSHKFKKKCDFY